MNTVFVPPNFMLPIMIALALPGEVVEVSGGCDSAGTHKLVLAVTTMETMVCLRTWWQDTLTFTIQKMFLRFQCHRYIVPCVSAFWKGGLTIFRGNGIAAQSALWPTIWVGSAWNAIKKFYTTNSMPVFFAFHRPDDSPKAIRISSSRSANLCIYLWPEIRS